MAKNFHFITTVSKPEGDYHLRLYGIPKSIPCNMRHHRKAMPKEIVFPDTFVVESGIGKHAVAYQSEIFLATPEFQNMKIKLSSDNLFFVLVESARSGEHQIWLEIVFESPALNVPAPKACEMVWPRKKRLYWWGKLSTRELLGTIGWQSFEANTQGDFTLEKAPHQVIFKQDHPDHIGDLDLTFIHWIKVKGKETFGLDVDGVPITAVKRFLDNFRQQYFGFADHIAPLSWLVNHFVQALSPTSLYAIADHRLVHDDGKTGFDSIGYGNLKTTYRLSNLASTQPFADELYEIGHCVRRNGGYGPFYDDAADPSPYSWYKYDDLSELFTLIMDDLQFKYQIELPTLDEAYGDGATNSNEIGSRKRNWTKCSRWYFRDFLAKKSAYTTAGAPIDLKLYITPIKETIRYQPCASTLGKVVVKEPQYKTEPDVREWTIPASDQEEGLIDVNYKTIFQFRGAHTSDPKGTELYVLKDATVEFAQWIDAFDGEPNTNSWGRFILKKIYNRFGGTRAIVEYDAEGIGIEPYGASNGNFPYLKDWALFDVGDFPMFRLQLVNVGLLFPPAAKSTQFYQPNPSFGEFRLFSLEREPGTKEDAGTMHAKIILDGSSDVVEVIEIDPPTPDEPPEIVDPPFPPGPPGEPISGIHTLFLVADDPEACIDYVEYLIDGVVVGRQPGGSGHDQSFSFMFDSTLYTNGAHTLTVNVVDCEGNVTTYNYLFLIFN